MAALLKVLPEVSAIVFAAVLTANFWHVSQDRVKRVGFRHGFQARGHVNALDMHLCRAKRPSNGRESVKALRTRHQGSAQ